MHTVLLIIHVLLAVSLIVLVLIQHGKGADAGAAFGSGASATVFGARGSSSFLTRATGILATLFFVTSLSLAYLAGQSTQPKSVTDLVPGAAATPTPNKPGTTSDVPVMPGAKSTPMPSKSSDVPVLSPNPAPDKSAKPTPR
jgi:preprotein translocase subunit SecG